MPDLPSLSPKFTGARFAGHAIPVELLGDIAAYRDLVRDVARELFLAANPKRKRVPRRFDCAFRLNLKAVKEGSAVAEAVAPEVDQAHEAEIYQFADYFNQAKALVEDTIRSVQNGGDAIPHKFPKKLLPSFGKIGRELRTGEIIDFGFGSPQPAPYSDATRKSLVLWASDEVEADVDVIGVVREIKKDPGVESRFSLQLEDKSVVSGQYQPAHEDAIIQSIRGNGQLYLGVKGVGVCSKQNVLLRFADVREVEVLDAADLKFRETLARIENMKGLAAGWCGSDSVAPSIESLGWAAEIAKNFVEDFGLSVPFVYPTPEGNIQFEWALKEGALDVRLIAATKMAEIFAYGGDFEIEDTVQVADLSGADVLATKVGEILEQRGEKQ